MLEIETVTLRRADMTVFETIGATRKTIARGYDMMLVSNEFRAFTSEICGTSRMAIARSPETMARVTAHISI